MNGKDSLSFPFFLIDDAGNVTYAVIITYKYMQHPHYDFLYADTANCKERNSVL